MGLSQILLVGLGVERGRGLRHRLEVVLRAPRRRSPRVAVMLGSMLLRNPPPGWKPPGWSPERRGRQGAARSSTGSEMLTDAARLHALDHLHLRRDLGPDGDRPVEADDGRDPRGADLRAASGWAASDASSSRSASSRSSTRSAASSGARSATSIDRPRAMMMMFLAQGMAFMLLVSVESHLAIFLASAWVGLNFGGNFALFPSATVGLLRHEALRRSTTAGSSRPTAWPGSSVRSSAACSFDATEQYVLAFVFAGILCFLAAGLRRS